jgi:plasmid stabilization system protein ParE
MNAPFQLTPQAIEDLDAIWWFIAERNRDAANRVELEIVADCRRLAKHPRMGTKRQDITPLALRFWIVTRFPNYVIVYRPDTVPLEIVAVVHGKPRLARRARRASPGMNYAPSRFFICVKIRITAGPSVTRITDGKIRKNTGKISFTPTLRAFS